MTGRIFDIQRNSYVDGPGIRTTVFLKGCNLRCLWCHNPEGLSRARQYVHFSPLCTGCGTCVSLCPENALSVPGKPDEKCLLCGKCADYCPQSAIRIYGREIDPASLMEILRRDRAYYASSGGGVTFSGGECMLQHEFLTEVCTLLRQEGISAAIDTAGNVPWENIAAIEPLADWFLYDVKALDPDVHRALTGVGNERILENLRRLLQIAPRKVILRIPVIPGANEKEVGKIAGFLRELPQPYLTEFLPYHRLGESKREALGISPFTAEVPTQEEMSSLRAMFRS